MSPDAAAHWQRERQHQTFAANGFELPRGRGAGPGRNKAERVYPAIEKSVVDYYSELDNPEDQEMFYDYLIANLKLYFDKWDSEMSTSVEEPTNPEYDQAKEAV